MKSLISAFSFLLVFGIFAQSGPRKDRNKKFVIETGIGINSPLKSQHTSNLKYNSINPLNIHGNINYAFNEKYGITAVGNYHSIKSKSELDSKKFSSNYYVGSVLFSLDLGHLFELYDTRTNDNIIFLVGPGAGINSGKWYDKTRWEKIIILNYGISYEHKLNEDFSLSVDAIFKSNLLQDRKYDLQTKSDHNGTMFYLSCGVSYLLDF